MRGFPRAGRVNRLFSMRGVPAAGRLGLSSICVFVLHAIVVGTARSQRPPYVWLVRLVTLHALCQPRAGADPVGCKGVALAKKMARRK